MECYRIKDEILAGAEKPEENGVCLCTVEELRMLGCRFSPQTVEECCRPGSARLESYEGYDFILLNAVIDGHPPSLYRVGLYVTARQLFFVCGRPCRAVRETLDYFRSTKTANLNLSRILHAFFLALTADDSRRLERFEEEVSAMEERIMENMEGDYTREIFVMRKRLMFYKKYYEQLLDVAEGIEENSNGLLSVGALRSFRIFTGRVDRLNRSVLNLRDYITQVREAYQSQVDIKLNEIMKLFTVVTAIFLPLTLLVGWYGMNFRNMPELSWPYGYAMAILISVVFIFASVVYFRKKKIL
ncbi:MAG: magnesium transporter [Clostridiales bacterium]|jgi:magnesium transporter|nr:magnesium transporter [Clostridiales bacterium]